MLTSPPVTDVAGHLRLVVARTARRLRQEAGQDLSPSLTAALASIDRHGPLTPSASSTRRSARDRRAAAVVRIALRPQLPALLRRPGRLDQRQLDADGRRGLADPAPDG